MKQIEIDIRTKIVAPDARIWRMFPGYQYEFLTEFQKSAAVFLELPGLSLPAGLINETTDNIRERIIRSWQVSQWLAEYKKWLAGSGTSASPAKPSLDLSTYVSQRKNNNYGRHFGAIQTLFSEVKQGDLVVVPNKIPTRQVLIGEFSEPPGARNGLGSVDGFNQD